MRIILNRNSNQYDYVIIQNENLQNTSEKMRQENKFKNENKLRKSMDKFVC